MRLFVGLELPSFIRQELELLQRPPLSGARWESPEQLHLTLRFIGGVPDSQVPDVQAGIANLASTPFTLQLQGADCFGPAYRSRVLWVGATPEAPLVHLHTQLNQRLTALGYEKPEQDFRPHVTLARFGRSGGDVEAFLNRHARYRSSAFPVEWFSLFASLPEPGGVRYQVLQRYPLRSVV